MPLPKVKVTLDPSIAIDPIPTGAGGIVRGTTITVKGTAKCTKETFDTEHPENDSTTDSPESITNVAVQLGDSGPFVTANPAGPVNPGTNRKLFTTWATNPRTITGVVNNALKITARVSAGPDAQATTTVTVSVDRTPPILNLTTSDEMTQMVVNEKTTFQLAGTASDSLSPVVAVEWMLDQGQQFTLARPKAGGDWSTWTAAVQVAAGDYQLFVRARDGEGNITPTKLVTLNAVEPFQPKDPSDVFSSAAYLDDLLTFAAARMVDAQGRALTRAGSTSAFHQSFDELTMPNNRDAAVVVVPQLRVCVEALRDFLTKSGKSTPAADEAKYRQNAYSALLGKLGTSFDEIRRARGDSTTRSRLADRLGVDQSTRLDQLMLLPDQVTEASLEQLFGLQDTTRNPLVRAPQPLLLTWQLARLRAQWQDQDNAPRVYNDISVPIIDPDLLVDTDFRTPNKDADPAYALLVSRRGEVTALLAQIDTVRKSNSAPLAAFDTVVSQFVDKIEDLTALVSDYQAGKDITAPLVDKRLSMTAFLRLMSIRSLAAAEPLLEADWADVYGIAAQTSKLGRYADWRAEEQAKGLTLGPDYFLLPDPTAAPVRLPEWRATLQSRQAWQAILQTRINQQQDITQAQNAVVSAAESQALPALRDLLVTTAGGAARGLLIDLAGGAAQRTTRLDQAIQTLQGALFGVRVGSFTADHPAAGWKLAPNYSGANFDEDWVFWGAYDTWQGAMRVFIYPESHLLPTLRPVTKSEPSKSYQDLIAKLRSLGRVNPLQARSAAADYLAQLRTEFASNTTFPAALKNSAFIITEQMTDSQLADWQALSVQLMGPFPNPHEAPTFLKEVFYYVPLLCALQLRGSGEYLTALDWFQTVYAYHLPPAKRKIYYGLTLEEQIQTKFVRSADWPREGLNPHDIVRDRANALTRFVVISLVQCFEQFSDAEFTRDTDESIARARTLYQTALDLLGLTYPAPSSTATQDNQFGLDPVVEALSLHAESNLRKLRAGRNIAGLERQSSADLADDSTVAPPQPTPYRYATLLARAKDLTQTSAQMEAALLAALEKRDAESYNLLKASQDVELASATVDEHDLQVKQAQDGIKLATLQTARAQIQYNHFDSLINEGVSGSEYASMALGLVGSVLSGAVSGSAVPGVGSLAGAGIGLVSGLGSLLGQISSNERREDDWELNRDLARQDLAIGDQQILLATDQVAVATQEQKIAQIQLEHAAATVQFLAGKFTNVELYEFMSQVLDGVYRFFLQQATAVAKLAENQLSFERQEPPQGIIQGDYHAAPGGSTDQQGITGSARLLADIVQLDQHAFLTDQRRLQLTKTFSLARLAPIEFERFRETGVIVVGTPEELFDRDFPGHYMRLIKRVRTSVTALISPTDGVHATLSTTGTSRVVIGGDTFRSVLVRRDPETVGLTSPRDATGLFDLEPDAQPELLLPFEGTGVDTVWRFELPKAANSFDYSTIAEVLLTIEYTALNSFDYREQVVQTLDPQLSLDCPFSFRQQFPDEWYELHNPDQAATPMVVRFKTTLGDFLPNIDDLKIQHLMFYIAPANGESVEVQGVRLLLKTDGDQNPVGGSADTLDGVISTRRTNGSNWLQITGNRPPIGEWELTLPTDDTTKNFFRNDEIEDILFVITYSGRTPEWPG
jgi:hypothetical protein